MLPQVAVGALTPMPKKLMYDSPKMASATPSVAETTIGAIVFGKICLRIISQLGVPVALAAVTKSFSFKDRNSARTIRAKPIQPIKPIIKTMPTTLPLYVRPANSTSGNLSLRKFAKTNKRKILGMDSKASVIRINNRIKPASKIACKGSNHHAN